MRVEGQVKMYCVCILLHSDRTCYVGSTHDLDERLTRHNEGRAASYTAIRRPVTLVYHEEHPDEISAIRRERQLKSWSHQKREAPVNVDIARLHQLN